MAQRAEVIDTLFRAVRTSWDSHKKAMQDGNRGAAEEEFRFIIKILGLLFKNRHVGLEQISEFLRTNEMPVRYIIGKVTDNND